MKKLESFKSTSECFKHITDCLSKGDAKKTKEAGNLFEEFASEWHLEYSDYVAVYDANKLDTIPGWIIDKIDGWELLSKGANSTGIDKIAVTRFNEIDVHQDKSSLHTDKNLSIQRCSLMMSLRNNGLKNIRHYILNTTAEDLSHYSSVWKEQKPLVYSFPDFCPNEFNADDVLKDAQFWDNIKDKRSNKKTLSVNSFIPRGKEQVNYINDVISKLTLQLVNQGYAKGFAKGAGSLGKSVLDPVAMAEIQKSLWKSHLTKSEAPVSVSFFHSSKTINDNGWEEVQRRRAAGIWDEVIVVSGTEVIQREGDDNLINDKFFKATSAVNVADKILECMSLKKSVLLLTLYHHAPIIEEILRILRKNIHKKFKFWARKRDECDWPCSTYKSSFAPALDDRTESVITFGSTGTERWGDPAKDYGTNNVNIHGALLHDFSWSAAEDAGLVKPLIMVLPGAKVSDLANLFPDFLDNNGKIDLKKRVNGIPVDNTYPTAEAIFKIACVAKALVEYPQIKRTMEFASFVKNNMLVKQNWKWVCDKVLGKSKLENSIKNMYIEVMNDDAYNSRAIKNHSAAIKRAKAKDRYVLASCRLFNRGYNDVAPKGYKGNWLKHHAGFHIDERSEVNLTQEIWRFTRLDNQCNDPFAYYICPMLYNDLDPGEPTWSESTISTLVAILKHNKNVKDDFESLIHNPSQRQQQKKKGIFRFWIPEEFDADLLNNLIKTTAYTARETVFPGLAVEAHDWLLNQYLQLDDPENAQAKGKIHKEFYSIEKFKPLYEHSGNKIVWRERFFHAGKKYSDEANKHINDNLMSYKLHCKAQEKFLKERETDIRKIVKESKARQIAPHHNFGFYNSIIMEKYNLTKSRSHAIVGKYCKDIIDEFDDKIILNNTRKVFDILIKVSKDAVSIHHWAELAYQQLEKNNIDNTACNSTTIDKNFIKKDHFNVLTTTEIVEFEEIKKEVKRKGILMSKIQSGQYKEGKFSQHNDLIEQLKNVTPFIKNKEVKNPMSEGRKKKISEAHSLRKSKLV